MRTLESMSGKSSIMSQQLEKHYLLPLSQHVKTLTHASHVGGKKRKTKKSRYSYKNKKVKSKRKIHL